MCPSDRRRTAGSADRNGCAPFERRLEAYLDGDLPGAESERVAHHLADCESCRGELELARSVRLELRSLPSHDAPERLIERVLSAARSEADRSIRSPSRSARAWWPDGWHPAPVAALAAALVAAVALVVPWSGDDGAVPGPGGVETAEVDAATIQQASAEARLALAYVSSVSRRTGVRIRDDVIARRWLGTTARELKSVTVEDPAAESAEEESRRHEI